MLKPKFGTVREVDIRELRKHDQYDFSAWLAEEEHIGCFYLFSIENRYNPVKPYFPNS